MTIMVMLLNRLEVSESLFKTEYKLFHYIYINKYDIDDCSLIVKNIDNRRYCHENQF
jgi:hypothetical protein